MGSALAPRWVLLPVALFGLAGCGDAHPGEATGQSAAAVTFANDQAAFDYFVGKGLTNFQAAGIVGNLDQESGVNPASVQAGGPGRGIAQWSVGGRWDTDSNDNAVWYASKQGQSVLSLQLQLDFIWYELTTFSSYGLAALRQSTNVSDATVTFETDFEGCGQCDQSTRISYAQGVLNAYGAVDYAAQFVSQSFPLATTTLSMMEGQVIPSYIELKNVGTKTWDAKTKIGTTQPRDRHSVFADGTWLSDSRLAAVTTTVAPGATYKFTFDLKAPATTGTYDEFFGVVEEGVAWFSDPGQGGPPDNDLEVKIKVIPAPPVDAGAGEDDAAAMPDEGVVGQEDGAVRPEADGGERGAGDGGEGPREGGDAAEDAGPHAYASNGGGCSVGRSSDASRWPGGLGALLVLGAVVRLLARRKGRQAPEA